MPIHDTFGPPAYIGFFLDDLAKVLTRGAPKAEAAAVIAAVLHRSPHVTEASLRDAMVTILEEEDRFPSPAQILRHVRRKTAPTATTEGGGDVDQEQLARDQMHIERLWVAHFEKRGNEHMARVARTKMERLQGWLDRRERGVDPDEVDRLREQVYAWEKPAQRGGVRRLGDRL